MVLEVGVNSIAYVWFVELVANSQDSMLCLAALYVRKTLCRVIKRLCVRHVPTIRMSVRSVD